MFLLLGTHEKAAYDLNYERDLWICIQLCSHENVSWHLADVTYAAEATKLLDQAESEDSAFTARDALKDFKSASVKKMLLALIILALLTRIATVKRRSTPLIAHVDTNSSPKKQKWWRRRVPPPSP